MNELIQKWVDRVQEQPWFQNLRAKWDELDGQSRVYLQGAAAVAVVLTAGWLVLGSWWNVRSLRNEIAEKDEILKMVQSSAGELRTLREQIPAQARGSEGETQPWAAYIEALAGQVGVEAANIEVSTESAGQNRELSKETFLDVTVKKVNVRQLTRFSYQMENGRRPVKIRRMQVETHPDMSGYLDVRLSLAAYTMKNPS